MGIYGHLAFSNQANTSKDFCFSARIRSTVLQGLPFGGVPTVLALDFMCFLVSLKHLQFEASDLCLIMILISIAKCLTVLGEK